MFITLETDYAVRMVYCLAKENRRLGANEISEKTGVTLRFALKILRKLVAGGIVNSFKGVTGGYELTKAPGEISLRDVVEIVDGPIILSRCLGDDYVCTGNEDKGNCFFSHKFNEISTLVSDRLGEITFADAI